MSEAFALVQLLAKNIHLNDLPGLVNLTSSENTDRDRFVEPVQALNAMMRRSWWHRIWTVQEAVLPKDGIVMCGSLEIPWITMKTAAKNWRQHAYTCCSVSRERLYEVLQYSTHGEPTYMPLSTFHTTFSALDAIQSEEYMPAHLNFMRTLQLFSDRKSTDLRDKVYGLLGVLEERCRPIQADYSIGIDELNRKLSEQLLLVGQFEVLYGDDRHIDNRNHPSWAKDFSQTLNRVDQRIEDLRNSNRSDYQASGPKSFEVRSLTKTTLLCAGILLDEVVAKSHVFSASDNDVEMKAFLRTCAAQINYSTRKDRDYPTGGTVREAFLRTAFGDRCRLPEMKNGVRRPKEAELQRLKEWLWDLGNVPPQTRLHIANNIKYNICNRVFFTTTQGFMGVGPSNMRVGDEVWMLFGARVPIVLRRLETTISPNKTSGSGQAPSRYRARRHRAIVGDCYTHGFMTGEALVDQKDLEVVIE